MKSPFEHALLVELMAWIDENTSGITLPNDERSMLVLGCLDVAMEHQAAIAVLHSSELYGSMLALLRVLTESLVRGLWLQQCASDVELEKFKKGHLDKTFNELIEEYEEKIGTPQGVLSKFKISAWRSMNGFTHTGFVQITRRHAPGIVGSNYDESELSKALGVAGALGLIAAGQIIAMSNRADLIEIFEQRMASYSASRTQ